MKFHLANTATQSKQLPWIIISIGIALRLVQYLYNRSLWMDEHALVINILDRSFSEVLQPLSHGQAAPIGFLIIEKLVTQLWNNSEYALRLFPLLSGIISLFLFYKIAKYCLKKETLPIALILFAVSNSLIYYSSEVKQYSSDVLITLILFWFFSLIHSKRFTLNKILSFSFCGATAIWFSHSSVFVLFSLGVVLSFSLFVEKKWKNISVLIFPYLLWILSFIACYFFSLRYRMGDPYFLDFWQGSFMPFPPLSLKDLKWFVNAFFEIFKNPLELRPIVIPALCFLFGSISLFSKRKKIFFILILPILFTLLASGFYMYPFSQRLLLFTIPCFLIVIAEGTQYILDKIKLHFQKIKIIFLALLLFYPLTFAGYHIIFPHAREEMKPVINYVIEHQQTGDILYLYHRSLLAFSYYTRRELIIELDDHIKIATIDGIRTSNSFERFKKEISRLHGKKRVWILFSSFFNKEEEMLYLNYLKSTGTQLDSFKTTGVAVYLYNFSNEKNLH